MASFSALKQKCYLRYAGYISDIEKEYAHHIRSLQSQKKRVIELVTDEFEKCIGHITACEAETQRRNQCKARVTLTEQLDMFMEPMNKEQIQQKKHHEMLETQRQYQLQTSTSPPPRPPMPSPPQHLRNDGDEMAQCSSIESLDLSECNHDHDHDSEYECAEDTDMDSDCNVVSNTHATHGAQNKPEKPPAHFMISKPAINDWGESYTDIEGPKGASNAFIASMEDTSNDITTTNTDKETERIKKKRNKNRQKRLKQFEQCKICKQKFASNNAFRTHCYTVHEIRQPCACPALKCDKRYATFSEMDQHYRRIHEQEINRRCESCKRPFLLQSDCVKHSKNCSNPYWRIPCKLCPENEMGKLVALESHTHWKTHMHEVHEIKQPYNCLVCLPNVHRFANKLGLVKHIRNVHKHERRFQCQLCSKSFFKLEQLHKHQRMHDGKKPFQCSICKKRFGIKAYLNEHHQRVHEVQKRYQCKFCDKQFYIRSDWIRHKKTHKLV